MPAVTPEAARRLDSTIAELQLHREHWMQHWRDLANYILPRRYSWLETERERASKTRQRYILDGSGTQAARTLAAGMLNGITSPARPWLRLRVPGFTDEQLSREARIWIDETVRRMLLVMAETNFYNSMAVLYADLVVFGTAGQLIYEHYDDVFRCYNSPIGEFFIGTDSTGKSVFFARKFQMTIYQLVERFGIENVTEEVRALYRQGGAVQHKHRWVYHLIEPNHDETLNLPRTFPWRETYWEEGALTRGSALSVRGFYEQPNVTPRWEVTGTDVYGQSPGMEALPDIKQLQLESRRKAQALDKMANPPVQADVSLANREVALLPGGITFVSGTSQVGVKPIYTLNPPIGEITADLIDIRNRIANIFHNDLFRMVSNLDTVRSATEIDARREEKLVLLGPVLERFENEALDPAIQRIYGIMERAGLIPEPPPELADTELKVEYVSILSEAQRAIGVAPTERFLATLGNATAVWPELRDLPDIGELFRDYADKIGVEAKSLRSRQDFEDSLRAQREQQTAQQAAEVGAPAAKTLSETDVGGGANALQVLLGGS